MNPRKLRLRSLLGLPIALASFYVAAQTTPTEPPAGRLLASNCFQCHGYNGKSSIGFEDLAGESSSEIYKELLEMRSKVPPKMMDMHARGYSDAQIRLIADYLSKQR
ncbi:MAG TPA: c-type cytochrome [Azonexus sp.]|nr:c-type cytochrome [Azonexus sp.]